MVAKKQQVAKGNTICKTLSEVVQNVFIQDKRPLALIYLISIILIYLISMIILIESQMQ